MISSLMTLLVMSVNKKSDSTKQLDNTTSSFHKIYSEDYFSDEDTISMLSQNLNSSNFSANRSFCVASPSIRERSLRAAAKVNNCYGTKSPLTSSVMSLHNLPTHQGQTISPNSSFNSFSKFNDGFSYTELLSDETERFSYKFSNF